MAHLLPSTSEPLTVGQWPLIDYLWAPRSAGDQLTPHGLLLTGWLFSPANYKVNGLLGFWRQCGYLQCKVPLPCINSPT